MGIIASLQQEQSLLRRVFTGVAAAAVLGVLTRLVSVLIFAYLARVLGPEAFGRIGFAETTVMYLMLISDLGLQTIGLRETARIQQQKSDVVRLVSHVLSMQLLFAMVLFAGLNLYTWLALDATPELKMLITVYGLCLMFPYLLGLEWWMNANGNLALTALGRFAKETLFAGGVLLLISNASQLLWIPLIQAVASLLVIVLVWVFFRHQTAALPRFALEPTYARVLLRQSWPIAISAMVGHFWIRSGVIQLGATSNEQTVGYYNAAWRFFAVGAEFVSLLNIAVLPVLSRSFITDRQRFDRVGRWYMFGMIGLGTCVAIGGWLVAPWFINGVYGNEYQPTIVVFQYLMIAFACWSVASAFGLPLLSTKYEKQNMIAGVAATTTCFVLNVLWIPSFEALGAVYAFLASTVVAMVVNLGFYWHKLRI
jgi:O-antigen/teichoic acid export membrane protein